MDSVKMESNYKKLTTEKVNKNSEHIDTCSTEEMLKIINAEDMLVSLAVGKEIPNIAKAIEAIAERLRNGGRLFYVGAGSSGRLGIADASECPPTYGTDPEDVQAVIAGGAEAVFRSVEGAEDNESLGRAVVHEKSITCKDAVVGISASGGAPYVIGCIREAKNAGAFTIGLSNNLDALLRKETDVAITPLVGPEVIMGSTRMKAGTSQKLVLNMISTSVMIKLGKVYGNLMVEMKPTNNKLMDRAVRIIAQAASVNENEARKYLQLSDNNSKTAIVMIKTGLNKDDAQKLLEKAKGSVSGAISLNQQ